MGIRKDDILQMRMNKKRKERLQQLAASRGWTLTMFIDRAITNYEKRFTSFQQETGQEERRAS